MIAVLQQSDVALDMDRIETVPTPPSKSFFRALGRFIPKFQQPVVIHRMGEMSQRIWESA